MKFRLPPALLAVAVALPAAGQPASYEANWASLDQRPCPAWYRDAKFGIFVHWGIYSVPAWGDSKDYAEWYWSRMLDPKKPGNPWQQHHARVWGEKFPYENFAALFRAEHFNAAEWAELFRRSGAKYVVPTSKHHDGFCLWPSAEADRSWGRPWNSVSTGPRRDLLGELATACRERDLKFGLYYSLYEWFHPLWQSDRPRFVQEHLIPQFKDVVSRYAPALIFSDGEWDLPPEGWRSPELLAWLYNEAPSRAEVVVNDRWGKGARHRHGTYFTTEYGAGMPDDRHPWEENRGIGHSYGFNRVEGVDDYKSTRELLYILIDLVSRGGNLLLNVGPSADGRIPALMQERLVELGRWLEVNGEAIFATRHAGRDCQWSEGTRPEQSYGTYKVKYDVMQQVGHAAREGRAVKQAFFTKKPGTLYAIVPGWPGSSLVLRNVALPNGAEVHLLGRKEPVRYERKAGTIALHLPNLSSEERPCEHAFAFRLPGARLLDD